jgi:Lrp/AsnC family leucine-responsive transcriptional regulator
MEHTEHMDQIDEKILNLLRKNARLPLKKIAEQVFLSPPAVTARIERMEQRGIILGYRAVVSPKALGRQIMAFIHLLLPPEQQKDFAAFAGQIPQITACYHVTGPYSMLIHACCTDMDQLDRLVAKLQRFGTTQTQVVLSAVLPEYN